MAKADGIINTTCGLCEDRKIEWKCVSCNEWMCGHCKDIHLRSKMARNHKVVSSSEAISRRDSLINTDSEVDSFCKLHPKETIQMYCQGCQTVVCRDCIAGEHQKHNFCKVEDIIDRKRRELSVYISQSKEKLSTYENTVEAFAKNSSDYSVQINLLIDAITAKNTTLKLEMDKVTDDFITQLKQREKETRENLKTQENDTNAELVKLKNFIRVCENKQKSHAVDVIRFVNETKEKLDQYETREPPQPITPPIFSSRDFSPNDLAYLLGELDLDRDHELGSDYLLEDIVPSIDIQVVTSISVKEKVNLIAAVDGSKAWVGFCGEEGVKLINADSQVLKKVETGFAVHDMDVSPTSGDLFITVHSGSTVKRLSEDGTFVDIYKAPPKYVTRGLCVADDGNVLVCIYSMENKMGAIHELNFEKGIVRKIQYKKDGKTPLFVSPVHVRKNRHGELCVLQRNGSVVLLGVDLNPKFLYNGKPQNFDPKQIQIGEFGHVFVSDCDNSNIHLLDKEGNFIQYILTKQEGLDEPVGLSMDKSGQLWVCSEGNNRIFVVRYLSGE